MKPYENAIKVHRYACDILADEYEARSTPRIKDMIMAEWKFHSAQAEYLERRQKICIMLDGISGAIR